MTNPFVWRIPDTRHTWPHPADKNGCEKKRKEKKKEKWSRNPLKRSFRYQFRGSGFSGRLIFRFFFFHPRIISKEVEKQNIIYLLISHNPAFIDVGVGHGEISQGTWIPFLLEGMVDQHGGIWCLFRKAV